MRHSDNEKCLRMAAGNVQVMRHYSGVYNKLRLLVVDSPYSVFVILLHAVSLDSPNMHI